MVALGPRPGRIVKRRLDRTHKVPLFNFFSYRKCVSGGDTPDVFVYDELPEALRVQISLIWRDAIGPFYVSSDYSLSSPPSNNQGWIQR